jgi:L-glyceraldehyde 3-phosphate reductase
MIYRADKNRYQKVMKYNTCGKSGIVLPKLSLGLWHNFGQSDDFQISKSILEYAFDEGITHFDLANNYGNPPGSAEENFGNIFKSSFAKHRDEILISTKAGHQMWEGPYGDGCSRKNLISSLNQSLKRLKLDYVDIFYSHRYDKLTPIEETLQALIDIVRSGKALYVGLSKYPPDIAEYCYKFLESQGVHCLIYQDRYSMLFRDVEKGSLNTAAKNGIGFCAFSPLAQGLLTNRYLNGIPQDSRVAKNGFLKKEQLTPDRIAIIQQLNELAIGAGVSLAQMSVGWLLSNPLVTTVLVGASSVDQLKDSISAHNTPTLEADILSNIRSIVSNYPTKIS